MMRLFHVAFENLTHTKIVQSLSVSYMHEQYTRGTKNLIIFDLHS